MITSTCSDQQPSRRSPLFQLRCYMPQPLDAKTARLYYNTSYMIPVKTDFRYVSIQKKQMRKSTGFGRPPQW